MDRCVIFCAGGFDRLADPVAERDYILAADGGLAHVKALGLTPHCVLGDFDSLGYTPENALGFPVEKDDTDTMLAVRQGLKKGLRSFLIYGALEGPRLDHTIANFQTLQFLTDHGARGYLVGEKYLATVVKNETVTFPAGAAGILSVFCMGADAEGVTLTGLRYPMKNGVLTAGFPLGVSNHFTGEAASVTVENGSLLMLYDRENGFVTRQNRRDI